MTRTPKAFAPTPKGELASDVSGEGAEPPAAESLGETIAEGFAWLGDAIEGVAVDIRDTLGDASAPDSAHTADELAAAWGFAERRGEARVSQWVVPCDAAVGELDGQGEVQSMRRWALLVARTGSAAAAPTSEGGPPDTVVHAAVNCYVEALQDGGEAKGTQAANFRASTRALFGQLSKLDSNAFCIVVWVAEGEAYFGQLGGGAAFLLRASRLYRITPSPPRLSRASAPPPVDAGDPSLASVPGRDGQPMPMQMRRLTPHVGDLILLCAPELVQSIDDKQMRALLVDAVEGSVRRGLVPVLRAARRLGAGGALGAVLARF